MPSRIPIDDATREQLVAYLDGELPDAASEAIEARLASDAALREQMQELDRVWNALDGLPRATVGDGFAKTTIEMAAVEAEKEVAALTAAMPIQRRRRSYAVAGACVGLALLGFALVRGAVTRQDRVLLARLPVVYRVDALQQAGGPDFLRQLSEAAEPLLATADSDQVAADLASWVAIAEGDARDRAAWVETLPDGGKARLLDAAKRYAQDLSATRREEVDQTYAAIAAAPDRDALMRTALAYESWLAGQPASDQSRLRQMEEDQRLAALEKLSRDAARKLERSLTSNDAVALRRVLASLAGSPELTRLPNQALALLDTFEERLTGDGSRRERSEFARGLREQVAKELKRRQKSPARAVYALAMAADGRSQMLGRWLSQEERGRVREQARKDWDAVEEKLLAPLSAEGRALLDQFADNSRRRQRLAEIVLRAGRSASESIDLEEFFASSSLSDSERHQLLGLPTEPMEQRLRELYAERVLGGTQSIDDGARDGWRRPGIMGGFGPSDRGPRDREERQRGGFERRQGGREWAGRQRGDRGPGERGPGERGRGPERGPAGRRGEASSEPPPPGDRLP